MKSIDRLKEICKESFEKLSLSEEIYGKKLAKELREIEAQGEQDYLLELHERFKRENLIFPVNEHNNLVDWLLGLAHDFDINKESAFIQGEMPDIDIDYIKEIRDYLKRDWAPKKFGADYVCEIGTYGKLGIKSAILDMAKMHGLERDTIQAITKKIKDKFLDDEGNTQELSWDDALELYPEFKKYCEDNPQVAEDAKKSLDRNKSAGVHAGGLIVSSKKISDFIPLEVRSVTKENVDGVVCSAWTEGLNRQDLGPLGLVKFDLLVISNLMQIALGCKMIKERHGLSSICALEGGRDWSDISYLNDPKAIAMANEADLKGIFQFDSPGIRNLVKKGGVSRFEDLVNYTSVYRPATLTAHMDVAYYKRKKGEEEYTIHPVLEDILEETYGIILYQEQCQEILRVVGEIPDMHTEKVRKAISKKKKKDFEPYKNMFIENGQRVLGTNEESVKEIWNLIEKFATYSFNKCVDGDTLAYLANGNKIKIKDIYTKNLNSVYVWSVDKGNNLVKRRVKDVFFNGIKDVYELTTFCGNKISTTINHKFLTLDGYKELSKLTLEDLVAIPKLIEGGEDDIFWDKIKSVKKIGKRDTYDLEVEEDHNWVANGIVVHNSHACAYTYISSRLLWIKSHYPIEFYTAILMCETDAEKFKEYKIDAEQHGVKILPIDINKSKQNFSINDEKIYFGFSNIKDIGEGVADRITSLQPYTSYCDFLTRFGTELTPIKALVSLGVFKEDGKDRLTLRKFSESYIEIKKSLKGIQKRFKDSMLKFDTDLRSMILEEIKENDKDFEKLCNFDSQELWEDRFAGVMRKIPCKIKGKESTKNVLFVSLLNKLAEKRKKRIQGFTESESKVKDLETLFNEFDPDTIELDEEETDILTKELTVNGKKNYPLAERKYYGFQWTHILETCQGYIGNTIDKLLKEAEEDNVVTGMIEIEIISVNKRTAKNAKKTEFYTLVVEDANGKQMKVNMWMNDFNKFADEIFPGQLVKMRVRPPSGGFNTLTFESLPFGAKIKKEDEYRFLVMKPMGDK